MNYPARKLETANVVPLGKVIDIYRQHPTKTSRLSIVGLGYVGAVSVGCFTDLGFEVVGVDIDDRKTARMACGKAPIVEQGLNELLQGAVDAGRVLYTNETASAVLRSDITMICVGTPSRKDGSCNSTALEVVSREIGQALQSKETFHTIVYRSTIPPGTTRDVLIPILEEVSGKKSGQDFGVAFHPEFLREGTAVDDFFKPAKTVIGTSDRRTAHIVSRLYNDVDDDVVLTTIETAELVKYIDNSWHAVKVSFANEIGKIAKAVNVDSHAAMDIFVKDTKLNISPYYMKPGFAFGGSCLPKDVRGITSLARSKEVDTPLLNSVLCSNRAQVLHAMELIRKTGKKKVGLLGLSFKAGTDDLRESPMLWLAGLLHDEGYDISIHDHNVDPDGAVRHHMQRAKADNNSFDNLLGNLSDFMKPKVTDVTKTAEVLIVGHNAPLYQAAVLTKRSGQHVIDLIRLPLLVEDSTYEGICW